MTDENISVQEMPALQIYPLQEVVDLHGLEDALRRLYEQIKEKELTTVGPPMAIYADGSLDSRSCNLEVAVPVAGEPEGTTLLTGGRAVVALHVGAYEKISQTCRQVEEVLAQEDMALTGHHYNIYVEGYRQNPDASEWLTKVVYPIA